jgi:hypothetical protein
VSELRRIAKRRSSQNSIKAKFAEPDTDELRRIPLPRTPVNKGKKKGRGRVKAALQEDGVDPVELVE